MPLRNRLGHSGVMEFLKSDGARTGLYFGATSGVITTLGLLTGLYAGTGAVTAVLSGILVGNHFHVHRQVRVRH